MVNINVWPALSGSYKAKAELGDSSSWIELRGSDGNEITIFGDREHIEKFRMMADIFNDAFAPEEMAISKHIAAHNAAVADDDLPF